MAKAETSWDTEYSKGRYQADPPVPFIADILSAARDAGHHAGLYIGCGNGRNYLPLVERGLDLTGLDISAEGLRQLAKRAPERRNRLVHCDLSALPRRQAYPIVIGIQIFQHGDRGATHQMIRDAQRRVRLGGLFCVRVNSTETDIWPDHEVIEEAVDLGITVRYTSGSKKGIDIHFFDFQELTDLFTPNFTAILPPRTDSTPRMPPWPGQWSQHEAIWRKDF